MGDDSARPPGGCCSAEPLEAGRNLRQAVQMVAKEDMALAGALCDSLAESKVKGQLKRALERREVLSPRAFFWSEPKRSDTMREG
jgi:hypothetical protein